MSEASTFLLEIGVEELPSSYVAGALAAMPGLLESALRGARIGHGAIRALGTPRRLSLWVEGLERRQSDLIETVSGPPRAAAFEEDGTPKRAALGFAKKLGVPVESLTIEETDKGPYVVGRRDEKGAPSAEVLPGLIERLFTKIPFPKSMRWGPGEVSFGRPVHWVVCLHGADVVDVSLAEIAAGRRSRGHRFLAPAGFDLPDADAYVDRLREARVLVDPVERKRVMVERLQAAATDAGGVIVEDAFLEDENMSMVEEPHVICGSFDEAFLELPDEVTIGVMRGHQRYFALRDAAGELLPRYLAVVNTDGSPETITRGNDRVLDARLADGRFFVEEDLKRGLSAMAQGLDAVTFQKKLGSVGARCERFTRLLESLFASDTPDAVERVAREAAPLTKADLVSEIVGEFPELQGIMGAWYARKEGRDDAVAEAIEQHYLPRGAKDGVPSEAASAYLAVADRVDLLVGCFGLGQVPTGSADPYALRRAALGVIRIAFDGPVDVSVADALGYAHDAYVAQGVELLPKAEVVAALGEFFRARLRVHLGAGAPTDVVDACLGAWGGGSLRDLQARLDALDAFRRLPAYESLAIAFKRAHNITKGAPAGEVDASLLVEDAERALARCWDALASEMDEHVRERRYAEALTLVAEQLSGPMDRFFDDVLVMAEDEAVRNNRLRLLTSIATTLSSLAHFHLLGA